MYLLFDINLVDVGKAYIQIQRLREFKIKNILLIPKQLVATKD